MERTLLPMLEKRRELKNQAQAMLDTAAKDGRPITAEEKNAFAELKQKIALWDDTINEMAALQDDTAPVEAPVNLGDQPNKGGGKFARLGEMLKAVYNAAQPNRPVIDERLMNSAGLSGSVPSDGGFLLQPEFSTELLRNAYGEGVLAPKCRKIPISMGNGLKINAVDENSRENGCRWGGIQAYWQDEADEIAASKPKFRQMDLSLQKLTGVCFATDELLQDAAALEAVISQGFADEFAFRIDDAVLNGTGAGQPLGVLNSGGLIKVAPESSQSEPLTTENVLKMWAQCWGRSRTNAAWYINQELEPFLYGMKIGDKPIYIPAGGLAAAPYATLMGQPVIPLEQCQSASAVGDILLADMSQYLLVDKGGIDAASSVHVRFLYDQNVFRFIYRCDGQPIWNKPMKPYRGSKQLSPFVALDKRN